jgi:predicted LPLAT superfamily acyltransferase
MHAGFAMSGAWIAQRERGSVLALRLLMRFALFFGRRTSRVLLYPVCLYYMLRAPAGRRASRQYLTRVFGRPATWAEIFRHHLDFATVLLDRGFMLAGRPAALDIGVTNRPLLRRLVAERRGCILLGAHFGSFEVARSLSGLEGPTKIHMMMYEENARKLNTVIAGLGGHSRMSVIPIGGLDTLMRAKDRLDQGEWVGILGDRAVASDRLIRVPFLGAEAAFPAGPFLMASALKVPVVLFACSYLGGNRYQEHSEMLAEEIVLDRRNPAELEMIVRRYAERLEHFCRLAPYNWFNFYDFWAAAPAAESEVETSRAA